ncbi:MAG: aminoglycoside phosphotransferase family protein [Bacteroidetes bacterium]|nr:aminoglycoside phosphotransferase family protein [Bacteroidota bacterium]
MHQEVIQKAAARFLGPEEDILVESLGNGLIHHTYKIAGPLQQKKLVLQAINTNIFTSPSCIANNYQEIYNYLQAHNGKVSIPAPQRNSDGKLIWVDEEKNYWRATAFIEHSYSPTNAVTEDEAYTVAKSFAAFTRSLAGIDIAKLKEIIPGFHNLSLRFNQFEQAVRKAPVQRLLKSTHIIAELRQRKKLVSFYESIHYDTNYPYRVMHHDCKISNILFDKNTNNVICPVDLDTTMPGKFFSDLGDMIRTMACNVDENSTDWESIKVRPSFYQAILKGYLEGVGNIFTPQEIDHIHYSGLILTYMQSLRFITDFLNGDVYYKINHPEQNLSRALNQLILLEKLEEYLKASFSFTPYS